MTGSIDGRDQQLALLMAEAWREEIEQAIRRVKKSMTRSELDRWFRKQWYRCVAVQLRREHDHRVRRRQIGEHGGDEDEGRRYRRTWGATRRPDWTNAVLRRPAASAIEEREESARIRRFRQRAGQEDV